MFDLIALENWYADEENSLLLQTELEKYFQNYLPCFHSEPQRKLFRTFILGLLSLLERKSIEPIALHFSGEKYVRPMQQFFSRSLFEEQPLMDIYHGLLSRQVGQVPGILASVNHRTAAFLESYFDIIFALNRLTYPGEKRMVQYAKEQAKKDMGSCTSLGNCETSSKSFEPDLQEVDVDNKSFKT